MTNHAIAKRMNCRIEDLQNLRDDENVWEYVGFYLAQLCLTILL